jgi:alanine dehydrogenase
MKTLKGTTLILKNDDIKKVLTMGPCIEAVEEAFRELALGIAKNLPRARIYTPAGDEGENLYWFNNLAGAVPKLDAMGLRIDSRITREVMVGGRKRKEFLKDSTIGMILLFRISTGELLAILDDPYISPLRVGATSAVALKYLARKNSSTIGLIGSGDQASAQLRGAAAVVSGLKKVKVFSMNPEHRDKFIENMQGEINAELTGANSSQAVVEGSDIVICATNSSEPVFDGHWLNEGATVVSIVGGDHTLKRREIDDVVLERSRSLFVNSLSQIIIDEQATLFDPVKKEVKRKEIISEIGDLLIGKAGGRVDDRDIITYHNNSGMGIQFAAAGAVAYKKAVAAGVGRALPAEWFATAF